MRTIVVAALLALVACGGSGGDGPLTYVNEDGVCRSNEPLPEGACPASYDEALEWNGYLMCSGTCGERRVVLRHGGYTGATCAYDQSGDRLVGVELSSDVNEYCDMESFSIVYGDVPTDCSPVRENGGCVMEPGAAG